MLFSNMRFFLPFLICLLIAMAMVLISFVVKKQYFDLFSRGDNFSISNINRLSFTLKPFLLILALIFIFFALLDPRWGNRSVNVSLEGIDIVFVMDISRSMATKDVLPDRLGNAKLLAKRLAGYLVGNRIALTAFAGFAFNVLPLSLDIEALSSFLEELNFDMIDLQGTNLEDAIRKALELFDFNTLTHRSIVIFTDGEDMEFSPLKQAKEAKKKGVVIFTVGIGTPEGQMIPIYDENGNIIDYLKENGKVVVSKLNENLLNSISKETGGAFFYGNEENIVRLAQRLNEIKKSKFGSSLYSFMEPSFQYFLSVAVFLLIVYILLSGGKMRIFSSGRKLLVVSLLFLLFSIDGGYASQATKGVREYRRGNFDKALDYFQEAHIRDPDNEKLIFNLGNTYYRLGKFDEALNFYEKINNSKSRLVRERAVYNSGNASLENQDYERAIKSYKEILLNGDPDSKIYKKALLNFLYAKEKMKKENQNEKTGKNQNSRQDKKNENKIEKNENSSSQGSSSSSSASVTKQPQKLSRSDVENLLDLIQDEEKKHLAGKKEARIGQFPPKKSW